MRPRGRKTAISQLVPAGLSRLVGDFPSTGRQQVSNRITRAKNTVVPSLNSAGADVKNVMFIHRVLVNGDTQRQLQLDSDTSLLKKA
jgi:hypothetical protein